MRIATAATIFWDTESSRQVLHVTSLLPDSSQARPLFDLSKITCPWKLKLGTDGKQHLLFFEAARSLQLCVSGTALSEPVRLVVDALASQAALPARLHYLKCLNDLQTSGSLNSRHFPADPRGRRLSSVLQALDGSLAGASCREIGSALFGEGRMSEDWNNPGEHLRDQVRRAVYRGRELMAGGYRLFLR